MKQRVSWKLVLKKKNPSFDGVKYDLKMRQLPFMVVIYVVLLFIIHRTTKYQYHQTEMESKLDPLDTLEETKAFSRRLRNLPHGIAQARSDLEMRPLWSSISQRSKEIYLSKGYFDSDEIYLIVIGVSSPAVWREARYVA